MQTFKKYTSICIELKQGYSKLKETFAKLTLTDSLVALREEMFSSSINDEEKNAQKDKEDLNEIIKNLGKIKLSINAGKDLVEHIKNTIKELEVPKSIVEKTNTQSDEGMKDYYADVLSRRDNEEIIDNKARQQELDYKNASTIYDKYIGKLQKTLSDVILTKIEEILNNKSIDVNSGIQQFFSYNKEILKDLELVAIEDVLPHACKSDNHANLVKSLIEYFKESCLERVLKEQGSKALKNIEWGYFGNHSIVNLVNAIKDYSKGIPILAKNPLINEIDIKEIEIKKGLSIIDVQDIIFSISKNYNNSIHSLVNNQKSLSFDEWSLSLLQLSDDQKNPPSNKFLLLEGRDLFAQLVVYKINIEFIVPFFLRADEIDANRQSIFGEMSYTDTKPIYYVNSVDLTYEKVKSLIPSDETKESENIFSRTLSAEKLDKFLDWQECLKNKGTRTLNKAETLRVDTSIEELQYSVNELSTHLDKTITEYGRILEDSGAKDIAFIKTEFEKLTNQPKQQQYFKIFYWSLQEYFLAYQILHSGIVQGKYIDVKDKAAIAILEKGAKYGAEFAKGIPFVGCVVGALDSMVSDIYTGIKSWSLQRKVNAINKVIVNKIFMEQDLFVAIAKTALSLSEIKKKEINVLEPIAEEKKTPDKIKGIPRKIYKTLKDSYVKIKAKIFNEELQDSNEAELAIEDVAKLLAYLYHNSDTITIAQNNSKALDKQFCEIIINNDLMGSEDSTTEVHN